jgi:hypothetical protein
MYDCDFVVVIRGVTYQFTHVENFTMEDPERTRLIRGSNAGNKEGLAYKEGLKEAKTATLTVIGMPKAVHDLLKEVYDSKERVDAGAISRADGSSKMLKNAILAQSPKQLTMDDSAESLNTSLLFESFDVEEIHKS